VEDGASSLFAPDVLTPSQFADLRRAGNDPIKNLMFAVLEQALRDVIGVGKISVRRRKYKSTASQRERAAMKQSGRASALRRDAQRWVFGDGDGPFSFRTCCETLEIDGERLRERIRERRSGRRREPKSARLFLMTAERAVAATTPLQAA